MERARAIATLPEDGELKPRDSELGKIRALDSVLAYHERRQVFHVVVIDVPQVVVGLHERSIFLLSRPALQILSAPELQALFSPLVFLGGFAAALAGLVLWGIGYATQDPLLKAVVAGMLPDGTTEFRLRSVLQRVRRGLVGGQHDERSPVRPLNSGGNRLSVIVQLPSLPLFIVAERMRRRAEAA